MFIPLRVDVPMWRRPWVNYGIIILTVIISVACFTDEDLLLEMAGGTGNPLNSVSSALVHGGWLHLLGNMVFLWAFGNAVNYKLGQWQYALFYVFCAVAADMAHTAFMGGPVVGASGAIYGVMGAFLVFFPRNNALMFFLLSVFFPIARIFTVPSAWMIILWVVWNILYLFLGVDFGVALWGHLGGFFAGFGVALVLAGTGIIKPTQDEQTLLQVLGFDRVRAER